MLRFRHRRSPRSLRISPLHLEFQAPLPASSPAVYQAVPRLRRGISQGTYEAAYTRFKPSDSEQRLPPLSYRDCWHRVSRGFLWGDSTQDAVNVPCLLTPDSSLHPEGLPPARGVAGSGLRPLPNIRYCSPPWRSGQCLSPDVAGRSLNPATRHSLGEPLPHQQADRKQAALRPMNLWLSHIRKITLSGIIAPFGSPLRDGAVPESKVRYLSIPHPFATNCTVKHSPFDLHVLATPPAFVLSQDQTLRV